MNRKSLILLSSLRTLVRGVAISALRRAETLNAYKQADTSIVTFDYCEDYAIIIKKLRDSGYLKNAFHLNIFDYFSSCDFSACESLGDSSIVRQIRHGKDVKKERCTKWCVKYSFPDGRNVFEYFRPNSDVVYLRAVTLGGHFLWDYTPEIELVDGDLLIKRFHGTREFWGFFIEEITKGVTNVHIFQDASYIEKGDTRDKFCAIKKGGRFYNYRIAHGATQVDIRKKDSAAIPSWGGDDEHREDYSGIVFLTENQRNHWVESQGFDDRLVVIPHESGVEGIGYTERDGDRCVCITSLTPLKHVDMAIKAFELVVKKRPAAILEIYGQGGEQSRLEELISDLSLKSNVFLKGYSINAQKALKGAAVSIVTSERESFGMPILESYAYSCPVVSFDVNYGPHELVQEGLTGYKVPFGSIDGLAVAILRVLDRGDMSDQLRRNCHSKSRDFSKEKISSLWGQLMESAESMRAEFIASHQDSNGCTRS